MSESNATRRPLTLDDLAALRGVSDPQISPDGRQVAFVVETLLPETNEIRSQIWLVDADVDATPRPLTAGDKQDSQPRWSPDGQRLAFVSNRTGTAQLWLLPLDGGEASRLTNHPIGVGSPAWSPDGRRLAFTARGANRRGDSVAAESSDDRQRVVWVREHRHKLDGRGFFGALRNHVWTIAADGGTAEQVTDGPYDDADPAWSPDSQKLAFASDRSPERDWHFGGGAIHVVDRLTGHLRRLTPENGHAAHPSWSPDGEWLAYVGNELSDEASPTNARLWLQRADDAAAAQCLTADLDRSVGQRPQGYLTSSAPAWLPDGSALLYLIGEGPATHLYRVSAGERVALTSGRRVVHTFSLDAARQRAALLVNDSTTPAEVWLWDATYGARPLTTLNASLLRGLRLAAPEDRGMTRPDGTAIEGWLLRPTRPTSGRVPLVLSVHGGPHNYFGDSFSFDHQLYAAQGYAVLYVNPRGSGGYGEQFAQAVCLDWGGEDYADLLAMVDDVLASEPALDPNRVGIVGSSYGGFMSCWAVTQTNRFAAAVAGACISNLVSFFGTSDIGASWGLREFGGTPYERAEWYTARSPITHAPQVQTPLFLYHGESDLRCPIEQSEQMFSALRRLGKTVELLRVPNESHGVLSGSPAHRIVVRQAILDWFKRYLDQDR
jgi:dipeptidyl aminopeptidase/acylaminoacyl peptidase